MKHFIDSKMKYAVVTLACLLIIVSSLLGNTQTVLAAGPAAVNLGWAGTFAILSKAGITDVPTSDITGNVGTSPISGTAIGVTCTEVTGTIYSVDSAGPSCKVTNPTLLKTAVSDMEAAYTAAAADYPDTIINEGNGHLGGLDLVPGVYKFTGASVNVDIANDLTLTATGADDVWIFQIPGTLTISTDQSVILAGHAQAKNIFWQVAGVTTLQAGSTFYGTILDATKIAMQSRATLYGRALAQTEVTLIANTIAAGAPAHGLVLDTPTPASAGVTSSHSIVFTTATDLPVNARIAIGFPAGFNVASAAFGSATNIDGTLTVSVSSQTINIDRSGGTLSVAGAKTIVLTGIVNPPTSGSYTISVTTYASNGGATLDTGTSAPFTITPAATFTPAKGPVSTTITVTGTGWKASDPITGVTVDAQSAANTLSVNGSGVLSGTITVPSGATGTCDIIITGTNSGAQTFASAFLQTTAMATFLPTSGPVGTTLTITVGTGWAPSDTISTVTVGAAPAANTLVVSPGGILSGTITVPALTPGLKSIVITGNISRAQIFSNVFTVTPAATFIPLTGPVGTVIMVSGTGWTASETISAVTVGTTATNTLSVNSSGVLSGTITVPSTTPGPKTIAITGSGSGVQNFIGAFTVTATATFTPNSGPAGTVITTVSGTGWTPSEHITVVTVGGIPAAGYSLSVDPSGMLSGSINTDSSLTNGIKTIVIGSVSENQTFSSAFTVTSTATIYLSQGWNLISLPLVPNDPTIANILPSNVQALMMAPYGQLVDCSYLSGAAAAPTWRWWTPDRGSTFSTMQDGKAYWMYVTQACSFTVTGTACGASSPGAVPPPRAYWMYYSTSYPDGWNLLGFKSSQTTMTASDYLAGLAKDTYAPILYRYNGAWVSVALGDTLIPGAGYYIRMYSNGSVLPPCN